MQPTANPSRARYLAFPVQANPNRALPVHSTANPKQAFPVQPTANKRLNIPEWNRQPVIG